MTRPLTEDETYRLENMIDACGLEAVAATLKDICYAKADHIHSNWQDSALGKLWSKAGTIADKLASFANKHQL